MQDVQLEQESKNLTFLQTSFAGGLNQLTDPTRLQENEYFLLLNGRTRHDKVEPINSPLLDAQLPAGLKLQGNYAAGTIQLVFVDGRAYFRDLSKTVAFAVIPLLQMQPLVDNIYCEMVPTSTLNFKRTASGLDLSSPITGIAQCIIVQDGYSQPWIINADGSARLAKTFEEWTDEEREYIPVGTLMCYVNGILYIVNGSQIYRSVTGRPTDFAVNIAANSSLAGGDATTTAISVDYDDITALAKMNDQGGSLFVSTHRNSYTVAPDFTTLIWGEPQFRNTYLFNTGALNHVSFGDLNGDFALIDSSGIRSFNAVQQFKVQGNNSPFSAKISPLFKDIVQGATAVGQYDNYVLFAVTTIYGAAVLVYDTILSIWVSVDIYSGVQAIKQFAEIKTTDNRRILYFSTVDNKLYQAFASDHVETCAIVAGEWCSNDPQTEHKPLSLNIVFNDITSAGVVRIVSFIDRLQDQVIDSILPQTLDAENPIAIIPFNQSSRDTTKIISFDLGESKQGWKSAFYISWDVKAVLTHIRSDAKRYKAMNSDEAAGDMYRVEAAASGVITTGPTLAISAVTITPVPDLPPEQPVVNPPNDPVLPTVPQGFVGVPTIGPLTNTLSWIESSFATGYKISRSVDGNTFTDITTIGAASTVTYADTGIVADTTYYYKIRAINAAGESAEANTIVVAYTALIPAIPTGIIVIPNVVGARNDIVWSASARAVNYTISRATTAGGVYTDIAVTPLLNYSDIGLLELGTYYYKIRATNAIGSSANSAYASATTLSYYFSLGSVVVPNFATVTGLSIDAGTYRMTYKQGAMKGFAGGWTGNMGATIGFYLKYNSSTVAVKCPGNQGTFATQAAVEAANLADSLFIDIVHTGGTMTLDFHDNPPDYGDNVNGSPNPTYQLRRIS